LTHCIRIKKKEAKTQNSGLATLHFEAALSAAIYSVLHNLTRAMLAADWRKQEESILFGSSF